MSYLPINCITSPVCCGLKNIHSADCVGELDNWPTQLEHLRFLPVLHIGKMSALFRMNFDANSALDRDDAFIIL